MPNMNQVIEDLMQIRHFTGHPARFWPAFLELTTRFARARAGLLLVQGTDGITWKRLAIWPDNDSHLLQSDEVFSIIEQIAEASAHKTGAWDWKRANGNRGTDLVVLGIRLEREGSDPASVAVFLLDDMNMETLEQTATLLKLVADTPAIYQLGRTLHKASTDLDQFSDIMDLMVLLNAETKYMAAAMTFVTEVASRYRCTRVSLGWLDGGYIRLQAVSHMERFEKKMDIVQTLEAAMEEAFDQNEEILVPSPDDSTAVTRDHEAFTREQGVRCMVSVPIRLDQEPAGVVTCERAHEQPFSEGEIQGLRVVCDQVARRLGDLRERDQRLGTRVKTAFHRSASRILGVEHTLAKVIGLIVCGALIFLLFGRVSYRTEAPFIIRSDTVRFLPAPFEGYIDEVHVKIGETVAEGDLLLTLDTADLLLEESASIANQVRYLREAEKARADNELAEMNIALALADQATAKLELARYHLSQAQVTAPFSGIVVEGDLEELMGAPVKQGDVLFKISRMDTMYAELEVNERHIHELAAGAAGEVAFVSQPHMKFPITVERIEPVALAKKDKGNVFIVRCQFSEGIEDWWRPGMSGIAKVSAGKRNVLWVLTHNTIDFFRMRLWW